MTTDELSGALSLTTVIRDHARRSPARPAVARVAGSPRAGDVVWWTYGELDEHARRVGSCLQRHGSSGERVLLFYPSGPDFVAAFVGCLYVGMVAVPAPVPSGQQHDLRRVKAIAENSGATLVLTDEENLAAVTHWAASVLPHAIVTATDRLDGVPDDCHVISTDRARIAMLQYTSGSTADPKGVVLSHGNLLSNAAAIARSLGLDEKTRFGGWIPNYHDMGLIGLIILPLLLGGCTALMRPASFVKRPHLWLEMMDELAIHLTAAPNFAFDLCRRRITDEQMDGIDLSNWKYAINGSEPVRPEVLAAFSQRFATAGFRADAMVPCYGLAETTLFVSGTPHRPPVVRRVDADELQEHRFVPATDPSATREVVSCGAVHECDVRVVDPNTLEVLDAGKIGEICLSGASVSSGYWDNPAATAATFGLRIGDGDEKFMRTGDLGVVHDGEVYVTGRIKEVIIIRGRNLYPQDIEHELRAHHRELDAGVGAVFSVPGEESVVVTHEIKGSLDEDELARVAHGVRQTVVREFGVGVLEVALLRPGAVRRTTSGKVERAAMRELFVRRDLEALHRDRETL